MEKREIKREQEPKFHMTIEEVAEKLGVARSTVIEDYRSAINKIKLRHPQLKDWL
jgi:predicted DNA-binding protein (UPF0251 family)